MYMHEEVYLWLTWSHLDTQTPSSPPRALTHPLLHSLTRLSPPSSIALRTCSLTQTLTHSLTHSHLPHSSRICHGALTSTARERVAPSDAEWEVCDYVYSITCITCIGWEVRDYVYYVYYVYRMRGIRLRVLRVLDGRYVITCITCIYVCR